MINVVMNDVLSLLMSHTRVSKHLPLSGQLVGLVGFEIWTWSIDWLVGWFGRFGYLYLVHRLVGWLVLEVLETCTWSIDWLVGWFGRFGDLYLVH